MKKLIIYIVLAIACDLLYVMTLRANVVKDYTGLVIICIATMIPVMYQVTRILKLMR